MPHSAKELEDKLTKGLAASFVVNFGFVFVNLPIIYDQIIVCLT